MVSLIGSVNVLLTKYEVYWVQLWYFARFLIKEIKQVEKTRDGPIPFIQNNVLFETKFEFVELKIFVYIS